MNPMPTPPRRAGFTLIELAMVVALLALLATLAISKYGGIRDSSARQVSAVNLQGVSEAVGTYLAFHDGRGLDRLDALVPHGAGRVAGETFDYAADALYAGPAAPDPANRGLSDGLRGVLCAYGLSAAEAESLRRDLGLAHVLRHATRPGELDLRGDDGSYAPGWASVADANASACLAAAPTNGFAVAAVDPRRLAGALVYRAMGQPLPLATRDPDARNLSDADIPAALDASGGRLVAFGLGPGASLLGNSRGGLESCPHSEAIAPDRYRSYVLLVRLVHTAAGTCRAEFAGVIDPEGRPADAARRDLLAAP